MGRCCGQELNPPLDLAAYRQALWIALAVNAAMFLVEGGAGLIAGAVSLQADALDFLGDAANYGVSLMVAGMSVSWRARAALLKGATMGLFGLFVTLSLVYHLVAGTLPDTAIMTTIGFAALLSNLAVAALLYRWRNGDANMRSVWLCSRNDALGNAAVLLAAGAVALVGHGWPDLLVAGIMAALALSASWQVVRQALQELRSARGQVAAAE